MIVNNYIDLETTGNKASLKSRNKLGLKSGNKPGLKPCLRSDIVIVY